jgi:RHS repeat-associated protein
MAVIRNHNNSVVALIDESGSIAESYTYTAYGEVTVFDSNGSVIEKSVLGNRYAFQGREIDWSTGLYNFRARWYDSETGRWLSKDPIGIQGGLNQYVFCGNNPVMFVDPLGLFTCEQLEVMDSMSSNEVGGKVSYV